MNRVIGTSGRAYDVTWAGHLFSNYISAITDSAGRTTTYDRNSSGDLSQITKPGGLTHKYEYSATGQLKQIRTTGTGTQESATRFEYDSSSRVTAVRQGIRAGSGFDPFTELRVNTYSYAAGATTITDANGHQSTYNIDSLGRVTSAVNANGDERSQTWTANSDIATTTDALASGSTPGNSTTASYDALSNATSVQLPTGAAASATYAADTSCVGGSGSAYQMKCSTDAAGNSRSYDYDDAGNILRTTDTTPGGSGAVTHDRTIVGYTGGQLVLCGAAEGQVCSSRDGNGNQTTYSYDPARNLNQVVAPGGTTTYTHDALGRVTGVTDPNGDTTAYLYNVRDDIVLVTFGNGVTLTTQYFPNGLKSKDIDSSGASQYFAYDALGQMTRQQNVVGTVTSTIDMTYDPVGNLLTYTDTNGTLTYGYDDANQLVQIIEPGGTCAGAGSAASSGCIKVEYNANGAETKRTFPGNATVVKELDNAGRTTRITAKDSAGATKVDIGYSFTAPGTTGPDGDRTSIQTRTSYAEQGITAGAVTAYTYDSLNRLVDAVETAGSTAAASWAYAYDDAGNRTQQVRAGSTGATAATIDYVYDAANRSRRHPPTPQRGRTTPQATRPRTASPGKPWPTTPKAPSPESAAVPTPHSDKATSSNSPARHRTPRT